MESQEIIEFSASFSGSVPQIITNADVVKQQLDLVCRKYDDLEVSEETLQSVKKDLANLRKKRADAKKKYDSLRAEALIPVDAFKAVFDDMISVVDQRIADLAAKVNDIMAQRKARHHAEAQAIVDERLALQDEEVRQFASCSWFWLPCWDNLTYSSAKLATDVDTQIGNIKTALYLIASAGKFSSALLARFKECGSLSDIQRQQAELVQQEAEAERIRAYQAEQARRAREEAEKRDMLRRSEDFMRSLGNEGNDKTSTTATSGSESGEGGGEDKAPKQEENAPEEDTLHIDRAPNVQAKLTLVYAVEITAPIYVLGSLQRELLRRGYGWKHLSHRVAYGHECSKEG